ncbi:efflux transporter outer membrane subunit [Methylotetracoccus oryzae]|uniref:efflux transporter outer membrane subunit n=1 Tax=Methylotetracoccus oryzae TaxID=1919059 RepID=UPI00111AD386|nr:efflux transporter outer membrane subunit [Methylotetracoccus oryzae]
MTLTRWLVRPLAPMMLLLVGCAPVSERPERAAMRAVPAFGATVAELAPQAAVSGTAALPEWWRLFGDSELNRLVGEALSGNPGLKTAEARLRESQSLVDRAGAELYPTLSSRVTFAAERFSATDVQLRLAGDNFRHLLVDPLVLRYHLDFWGQDRARLQQSIAHSLAIAAERDDARLLLAASVAAAYFELQAAEEQARLARDVVADATALQALEQSRWGSGLTTKPLLLRTQAAVEEAVQLSAGTEATVRVLRNLLANLAGQGPDWGRSIRIGELPPESVPALPVELPLHLLASRPDLRAARLEAESAAEAIEVARTAFYPDVNLVGFAGLHTVTLTDVLFHGSSLAYAVGPTVTFPLFEGGRLQAALTEREALYDLAVERYNDTLLRAVRETADALVRLREWDAKLDEQARLLAETEEAQRVAEATVSAGLGDRTVGLRARLDVLVMCSRLAELRGRRLRASVALCQAMGSGWRRLPARSPAS